MVCPAMKLRYFFSVREANLGKHAAEDLCPCNFLLLSRFTLCSWAVRFFGHFVYAVETCNFYLEHI